MKEQIMQFFLGLPDELYVFLISMLPIIELRGAIPAGALLGLPFYINLPLSILGNILPVPFILIFISRILDFLEKFKTTRPVVTWLRRKAGKHKKRVLSDEEDVPESSQRKMTKALFWAMMLFVAIPLPGTGAWTGSLISALFNIPKRKSFLAILIGVILSGIIMTLASYGVIGFLSFLI